MFDLGIDRVLERVWGDIVILRCGCMAKTLFTRGPTAWDCCSEHFSKRREWYVNDAW